MNKFIELEPETPSIICGGTLPHELRGANPQRQTPINQPNLPPIRPEVPIHHIFLANQPNFVIIQHPNLSMQNPNI